MEPNEHLGEVDWNMASLFYQDLQEIERAADMAYFQKNVRDFWYVLQRWYDKVYSQLDDKESEKFNLLEAEIEKDIYNDSLGDILENLWTEEKEEIEEFRRQMRRCRLFSRKLKLLMQRKGMITPRRMVIDEDDPEQLNKALDSFS